MSSKQLRISAVFLFVLLVVGLSPSSALADCVFCGEPGPGDPGSGGENPGGNPGDGGIITLPPAGERDADIPIDTGIGSGVDNGLPGSGDTTLVPPTNPGTSYPGGNCPSAQVIPGAITVWGEKLAPAYPLVVGQDESRRGIDVRWNVTIWSSPNPLWLYPSEKVGSFLSHQAVL